MNTSHPHLQFASLVELAEQRATPRPAEAQAHLSSCTQCTQQLSQLQEIIGLMRTDATTDAPHNTLAHALNLFDTRRPSQTGAAAASEKLVARRILAALNFDSMQSAPAFGLRSGQATERQLLFSAGDHELDVRVRPNGETWVVSGQVLGHCTGGEIELEQTEDATVLAVARLNDVCEFALPAVPHGSYTLRLRLGESEVEVPGLELRA